MGSQRQINHPDFDALIGAAAQHALQGDYVDAVAALQQALPLCQDDTARARVLALLAHHYPRLGNLQDSVRCASEAVALCQHLDEPRLVAEAQTSLSYVYAQLLMGRDALDAALHALKAARRAGNRMQEAWALNRLGVAYGSMDNIAQARESTQQALEVATPLGDGELSFSCLNNLAYFWLQLAAEARTGASDAKLLPEALGQARALAEQASAQARASRSEFQVTVALSNLVEAMLGMPDHEDSVALIDEYQALAHRHGYLALELQAQMQRAWLLQLRGQHQACVASLMLILAQRREHLPPALRRKLIHALYEASKAGRDFEAALSYLEQHAELERQIARETMALQTEVMLIRQDVEQAHARAEHALVDARRERERATRLEREQERLRHQAAEWGRAAHEDVLTGLHNRRHAEFALPVLLERARQEHKVICLAMLDVDHFKDINDRHGHGVGDEVLRQLAGVLRYNTRSADLLARVGGEEFMIALVGIPLLQAQDICERLRIAISAHAWQDLAPGLAVTISLGLTGGPPPEQAKLLVDRADHALYAAKRAGRNRVEVL
jgi:diguanylate cyclase (GGDEF)-like protein